MRAQFKGCSRSAFDGGVKCELRAVHRLCASWVRVASGGRISRAWGLDVAFGFAGSRCRRADGGELLVSVPVISGGGAHREHGSMGRDGLVASSHGRSAAELGRRQASGKTRGLRGVGGEPLSVLPVLRQFMRGVGLSVRGPPRGRRSRADWVRWIRRSDCWDFRDFLGWFAGYASALLHAGHGFVG